MKTNFESFNYPSKVTKVVCCDYDETYLPFNDPDKHKSGISELEKFIDEHGDKHGIIIGWVTGSSLDALLRKSNGYVKKLPHFIASSLGTELYMVDNGTIIESEQWIECIKQTGFDKKNIQEIIHQLESKKVELAGQHPDYQGKFTESFYYRISDRMKEDFADIQKIAEQFNIKTLITKCNPGAGDPADCYDIQFVPACCGKKEALLFLSNLFEVDKKNTWAFGDSFNDFEMLMSAGNAFLVANADPHAKTKFPFILEKEYCLGIKEKLEKSILN